MTKIKYNEQTLQLFNSLNILKLKGVFNLQVRVFIYEYNMDVLPLSLRQCFTRNDLFHHHNTRNSRDFHVVSRKSFLMYIYFIYQAPNVWSNLPNHHKQANSSICFKCTQNIWFIRPLSVVN